MGRRGRAALLAAGVLLQPTASWRARDAADDPLPPSSLAVRVGDGWTTWWRSDAAPARWPAEHPGVARAIAWRAASPGVEWGELALSGGGEAWRLRAIVVRVDPARVTFALDTLTRDAGTLGGWTVDSVGADAVVALNAGQFAGGRPWGWVVRDGAELRPPAIAPLASTVVVRRGGAVALADPGQAVRSDSVSLAFQSYPTLLAGDGEIPRALRASGRGVDVAPRDARLAVGERRDGRLLFLLTRFDALGEPLGVLPFGPTVPELAALMGALGCRRAVALDGGISGQLLVREGGAVHAWRGLRRVPLGLVVVRRAR